MIGKRWVVDAVRLVQPRNLEGGVRGDTLREGAGAPREDKTPGKTADVA